MCNNAPNSVRVCFCALVQLNVVLLYNFPKTEVLDLAYGLGPW